MVEKNVYYDRTVTSASPPEREIEETIETKANTPVKPSETMNISNMSAPSLTVNPPAPAPPPHILTPPTPEPTLEEPLTTKHTYL